MENTRELYRKKAESQMKEIGAKIDELKAKSEQADADLKIEINNRIGQLETQRKEAQAKLQQIKEAGEDAFGDLKAGIEVALADLKSAVDIATDRFRSS